MSYVMNEARKRFLRLRLIFSTFMAKIKALFNKTVQEEL